VFFFFGFCLIFIFPFNYFVCIYPLQIQIKISRVKGFNMLLQNV